MTAELHTLTGAYALDAVASTERAEFELHLRECPSCRLEVREFRATAGRLALAVRTEPPPELKVMVLAEVANTRQRPPRIRMAARRSADAATWRTRMALIGAAAAAVVAVVFGVHTASTDRQFDAAQQEQAALNAVLLAPDAVTSKAINGPTTVVVSPSRGRAVVLAGGLPALDAWHVYQVWLIGSGGPSSAGLLHPESPHQMRPVLTSIPLGTTRIDITVEPSGGSEAPTTPSVSMTYLS